MVRHVCERSPIHGSTVSIHRQDSSLLATVDGIRCECFVAGGCGGMNALRLPTTLREEHVIRSR